MLRDFLREVVVVISGKQTEEIADLLNNKKYVNEFLIAKKLDITINQTRNILYRLSDHGLVSSIRKKDKKKGWYTYFWKIEISRALEFLKGLIVKSMDQIRSQIKSRETKQYYICERCNIELTEEHALLYNFTCNECGGIFSLKDDTKVIKELEKNLAKLDERLKLIDVEIDKENVLLEKKKLKELKKEQAEKVKKKQEAAKKRAEKRKASLGEASAKKKGVKKSEGKVVNKKIGLSSSVKRVAKKQAKSEIKGND